jgi:hypothetical protein
MLQNRISTILVVLLGFAVVGLAGCAAPANREAMVVQKPVVTKKFAQTVSIDVNGGNETGSMDSSNISSADLKAAIESSIVQSSLFKSVIQGKGGDFELSVMVTKLAKPSFGFDMTVELETGWSLVRVSDKAVVLRKSVKSSHTATMSDAFAGVTRLRMAVEGAARDNIAQGLAAISELSL